MKDKLKNMSKLTKLLIILPIGLMGLAIFTAIGGLIVMWLWNWLAPELFGLRLVTFWQAVGLLALCRVLFGGFGLNGGGRRGSHRNFDKRVHQRVDERLRERWEQMTPEDQERFREGWRGRGTTPLDSTPA